MATKKKEKKKKENNPPLLRREGLEGKKKKMTDKGRLARPVKIRPDRNSFPCLKKNNETTPRANLPDRASCFKER